MGKVGETRTIDWVRISTYLLNVEHAVGKAKAAYFTSFGFQADAPDVFSAAIDQHADTHDIVAIQQTQYGKKFIVDCSLATPDGRNPCIRVVWQLDAAANNYRLITAYPAPHAC